MSKIEVNTIEPQCGTTLTVGAAGTNVTVPSNVVKSNALQASDAGNIIKQCGTTVTLGATGDTIALASGASQTGFGRTGTVDWITTPKVTGDSPVTGVTGKGYFLNTTAGVITLNLPVGAAGSIVSMADYAGTWQTYAVTVAANGTEKIGGVDADVTLSTEGQSVTFVYVDAVQGWLNIMDSTSNVRGNAFIAATGGTPCSGAIVCTNYKVHTFTGPGTFCVTSAGDPSGSSTVDYLVVAGGGGGGNPSGNGGGGGAGGYRESPGAASGCYTVSPLGVSPAVALPVTVTGYPIVVGGGGASQASGGASSFSSIPSAGGGYGGLADNVNGVSGGSGGGGGSSSLPVTPGTGCGGAGNTPPVTPPQGNSGGTGGLAYGGSAGAGGATSAGTNGNNSPPQGSNGGGGPGGNGATSSINATPTTRAGGGGGGGRDAYSAPGPASTGGPGGGGAGGLANSDNAVAGTVNTGGGGGGAGENQPSKGGGSGIVIIRYKFQ